MNILNIAQSHLVWNTWRAYLDKHKATWQNAFNPFVKPSPRPFFIKVTSQILLCEVLAKYLQPSTIWGREARKEEALDKLHWKDERGPLSVRKNIGTVSKASERWGGVSLGFSKCIDLYHLLFFWKSPFCHSVRLLLFFFLIFITLNIQITMARYIYMYTRICHTMTIRYVSS